MKKVLMIFGTRPEAIKMASVYHKLKSSPQFNVITCITGQHREMLQPVLDLFNINADIDLDIMQADQDLYDITALLLTKIRDVLAQHKPDLVLVHGDTTTTFSASVAAFYANTKVAHIEAGLRTNNIQSPFPEEFNRQVVSKIAHIHFAPTSQSKSNLLKEQVAPESIAVTGNTVIDALLWTIDEINSNDALRQSIINKLAKQIAFDCTNEKIVLITGHRRENFGNGFLNICKAISKLAKRYKDIQFVYPVHLNPNVQQPMYDLLSDFDNVHLIAPLDYSTFIYLMQNSYIILTDSGGIQEEAPSLGKPVLVMRDTTERPEAVEQGTVKLVGAQYDSIISGVSELLDNEYTYQTMAKAINPYGDGLASERISAHLEQQDF